MSNTPKAPKVGKLVDLLRPQAGKGEHIKQVIPYSSDQEIVITKHAAYKRDKNRGPKFEVIRLERPAERNEDPTQAMRMRNKDRTWKGETLMTPALWDWFGEVKVRYVMGRGKPDGSFEMIAGVSDPMWADNET